MDLCIAMLTERKSLRKGPALEMISAYQRNASRYSPVELRLFANESALLGSLESSAQRTRPALILAESRGRQLSSEEFAALLGDLQDRGTQTIVLAIGPADGWSKAALARADHTVAFGRITLPHELAAVVLAEQVYRALTIRAGHPYHSGH